MVRYSLSMSFYSALLEPTLSLNIFYMKLEASEHHDTREPLQELYALGYNVSLTEVSLKQCDIEVF